MPVQRRKVPNDTRREIRGGWGAQELCLSSQHAVDLHWWCAAVGYNADARHVGRPSRGSVSYADKWKIKLSICMKIQTCIFFCLPMQNGNEEQIEIIMHYSNF
jgi:hypothetical protein